MKEKIDLFSIIEVKLHCFKQFRSLNEILYNIKEIKNIEIEELEIFRKENFIMYTIFQICKYYNLDFQKFNNGRTILFRQKIIDNNIETKGIKDFYIQNKECECIICKRKFMASRSNIKRCNSIHYCYVIDYFTGKIYKKEIMKWNKIYWENNKDLNNDNNHKEICYLEGLCFSNKSNQVSVNNMMTLFNHTNNMQNMTTERRQKIIIGQKERGTFALTTKNNDGTINEEKYEKHSKNSKILAKKRIEEGTHNFLNPSKETIKLRIENSVRTKKENGTYDKMF